MLEIKKREEITKETLLRKVNDWDVYKHYIPHLRKEGEFIKSPMPGRSDTTPSFKVEKGKTEHYHVDFGDGEFKGDCIALVMQMYGDNYGEALKRINKDMALGSKEEIYTTREKTKDTEEEEKKESIIQCKTKRWDTADEAYWGQFFLRKEELMSEDVEVYPLRKVWVNKKLITIKSGELVFGYLFPKEGKWKIYRPHGGKMDKWISNIPLDYMYGLGNIKECEKGLITKAVKDYYVIRKFYPHVCGSQNESSRAISEMNISYLRRNSDEQWVNFDGDEAGKKNSWYYTNNYNMKHINVPDSLVVEGIKDFADMARVKGLDAVIEYFKLKGLVV